MKDFELGQVYEGQIDSKSATVVVVRSFGDLAEVAVTRDSSKIIMLHRESMNDWKPVPATERDWYLEGVWSDNHLLWSVFIPGFDAAWAFFGFRVPDLRADGGNIRVGTAENASDDEKMTFDDAGAYGSEPFLGEEVAIRSLRSYGRK